MPVTIPVNFNTACFKAIHTYVYILSIENIQPIATICIIADLHKLTTKLINSLSVFPRALYQNVLYRINNYFVKIKFYPV